MNQFSFLNWNIMGARPLKTKLLRNVVAYLEKQSPHIICLQENPHKQNIIKQLPTYSAYHTVSSTPPLRFIHNTNTILSTYPIITSGEISFSPRNSEKLSVARIRDRHNCMWADIQLNSTLVRVYNCQLKLIATTVRDRLRAIERVFAHAHECSYPIIICGDMNTIMSLQGVARKILRWFNDIEETHFQPLSKSTHPIGKKIAKETHKAYTRVTQVINKWYEIHGKRFFIDERFAFRELAEEYNFSDLLAINVPTWAVPYTNVELFKLKLDWVLTNTLKAVHHEYGPYISDHRPIHVQFEL